jgi:enoyl-CoA hydratase/carnithine racemase
MAYEQIVVDVTDQVATISLHRPERRNAWTFTMLGELNDALRAADLDDGIRVVVLTGGGDTFTVGADLEGSITRPGEADPMRERVFAEFFPPSRMRKPVIAALNGDAVGVGTTYPLHCDLRLVAEDARLGMVFVRRGLVPELASHWTLAHVAGFATATDLILSGRIFDGREAVALGVCHRALPRAEVLTEAHRIAREIVDTVAPAAVAAAKRLLWRDFLAELDGRIRDETALFTWAVSTPDATEGIAAFLEKRPPRWSMRPSTDLPLSP